MLIKNYGLFWHIDRVQWGGSGKGNAGALLGRSAARKPCVDFRNQRGVYALYDHNYSLLYVGQAGYGERRLYDRLAAHRWGGFGERVGRFSFFGVDPVIDKKGELILEEATGHQSDTAGILDHLEAIAITIAEPMLNKQGGRFGKALGYWQETESGGSLESRLAAIEEKLGSIEELLEER